MRPETKKALVKRIKALMRERGYNRERLARAAGIGDGTVGYMIREGDGNPTLDNIDAVARVFKVAAWELLFDPDTETERLLRRSVQGAVLQDAPPHKKSGRAA